MIRDTPAMGAMAPNDIKLGAFIASAKGQMGHFGTLDQGFNSSVEVKFSIARHINDS